MALDFHSVMFASPEPQRAAAFWGTILDRGADTDAEGVTLHGTPGQVGLRFVTGPGHGVGKNRLHLHLSEGSRVQRATIAASIDAGARLLGNGHVPENSYAVMEDPGGDEFCVIEDGNSYLAGCGPLGEVTCAGTRAVGHFWSQAVGWPLVWEEGDETAIQSPAGGTKIAWSGDPEAPGAAPDRQTFVLTAPASDMDNEVERLIALGATARADGPTGERRLADIDGNVFVVLVR
ncbi:MAG: VOC family protein [Rhodoglobus sp.]